MRQSSFPSSGSRSRSSTPHAPRLLQRPLRLNTISNSLIQEKHASKAVPTKTSLIPCATPITTDVLKSERAISPAAVQISWNSHTNKQKDKVHLQPFRRCNSRKPPKLVPQLDLSLLKGADHKLEPITISSDRTLNSSTDRISAQSWGAWRDIKKDKDMELLDCEEEEDIPLMTPASSVPSSLHNNLKRSHLDFIENKLLSHEQSRLEPLSTTTATAGRVPVVPSPFTPGYSMASKLQFEARIITHNGRDVHRQLCGYFFMDDGSLTIYEFRQFGKKLNALPLIHRGMYCVCSGRRKGHPYQITHIKKGAILQFGVKDHSNLPLSLQNRSILYVRITEVNEERKKELLCKDIIRPEEKQQKLECVMNSPSTVSAVRDAHLLVTMQGMVCHLLTGRASQVLVGLGRHLKGVVKQDVVTFSQLEQALRSYHIGLTTEDMMAFWKLLQNSPLWNESLEGLYLDSILQVLTGVLTEDCSNLIRQIFIKLDSSKSGMASLDQVKKMFKGTDTKLWQNMLNILIQKSVGGVSYADFEHYHIGVRLELASNSKFIRELKSSWCL